MTKDYPFSDAIRKRLLPTDEVVVTGIDQDKALHKEERQIVYAIFANGTFLTTDGCIFSEESVTGLIILRQTLDFKLTPKARKILDSMSTGTLEKFATEPE